MAQHGKLYVTVGIDTSALVKRVRYLQGQMFMQTNDLDDLESTLNCLGIKVGWEDGI